MREESKPRAFGNILLRKIFGPKLIEVTSKWVIILSKGFYDVYSSSSTIRVIKSRRMRWAEHVARREDRRGT